MRRRISMGWLVVGTGDQIELQDIAFVALTNKSGTKASFTEAASDPPT
jgi:hypothetical protein